MRRLPLFLACALLLAGPLQAQEEEDEAHAEETAGETQASESDAASQAKRFQQPFRAAPKRAPAPASGSAPMQGSAPSGDGWQSTGGVGLGQGNGDKIGGPDSGEDATTPGGAVGGGDGSFTEIDIGLLPTLSQVMGRAAGDRPVFTLAGGKKWAIRIKRAGSGLSNFNIMMGGTNGDLTGGGKYRYRAAISSSKGVVSGSGAQCEGQMVNAAYTTCQQPCSMKWDLRFGTPQKDRVWKDTCELDNNKLYYLNVEPVGGGCTGSPAEGFGCPLVIEASNGGQIVLNPGGPAAACAHRGFGYEGGSCR